MMSFWPFRKRATLLSAGLFNDFVDGHSHILPGVDDGVRHESEAVEILSLYESFGVRRVWLTPHVMEDIPNTTTELRMRFEAFCRLYDGSVELRLSSENMLDGLFEERLSANDLLPYGDDGDRLLVETSYFTPPYDFYDKLDRIKHKGYYPVLAHPERYMYMDERMYCRLKDMGVLFQLNIPSLAGFYGTEVRRKAAWLLRKGFYDISGCDVHSIASLKSFISAQLPYSASRFGKMLGLLGK